MPKLLGFLCALWETQRNDVTTTIWSRKRDKHPIFRVVFFHVGAHVDNEANIALVCVLASLAFYSLRIRVDVFLRINQMAYIIITFIFLMNP